MKSVFVSVPIVISASLIFACGSKNKQAQPQPTTPGAQPTTPEPTTPAPAATTPDAAMQTDAMAAADTDAMSPNEDVGDVPAEPMEPEPVDPQQEPESGGGAPYHQFVPDSSRRRLILRAPPAQTPSARAAEARLERVRGGKLSRGKSLGTMTFVQSGNLVTITGKFTNLPRGKRGIQIRASGDCNGAAARYNGKHFNPTDSKHGPPESAQRHAGDFGNLVVDKQGNATFTIETDSLTVRPGPNSVIGRAIVITARADNGRTQPHGRAGAVIACGTIQQRAKMGSAPKRKRGKRR